MNGYRSHLLCRPVFRDDAKENQSRVQGTMDKEDVKIEDQEDVRAESRGPAISLGFWGFICSGKTPPRKKSAPCRAGSLVFPRVL
jgi:hypothetical protein